jgi:hypothetical protein
MRRRSFAVHVTDNGGFVLSYYAYTSEDGWDAKIETFTDRTKLHDAIDEALGMKWPSGADERRDECARSERLHLTAGSAGLAQAAFPVPPVEDLGRRLRPDW